MAKLTNKRRFRRLRDFLPVKAPDAPVRPLAWRRKQMGLTWAEYHALQIVSFAVDVQVVMGALPPDEALRLMRPTRHVTRELWHIGEPTEPMPTEEIAICDRDTYTPIAV